MNGPIDSAQNAPGKKILMIDDESVVREIGSEMVETLGFDCLTAEDGKTGIEIYKKSGDSIDLVILDVEMPGISGEKVFDILREINPNVKILVISGYTRTHLESNFFNRKLKHFMPKPFQLKQLSAKLKTLIPGDQ